MGINLDPYYWIVAFPVFSGVPLLIGDRLPVFAVGAAHPHLFNYLALLSIHILPSVELELSQGHPPVFRELQDAPTAFRRITFAARCDDVVPVMFSSFSEGFYMVARHLLEICLPASVGTFKALFLESILHPATRNSFAYRRRCSRPPVPHLRKPFLHFTNDDALSLYHRLLVQELRNHFLISPTGYSGQSPLLSSCQIRGMTIGFLPCSELHLLLPT